MPNPAAKNAEIVIPSIVFFYFYTITQFFTLGASYYKT